MSKKKKRVDFAKLRELPIREVADRLGISLVPQGAGVWAMRDPERPKEVTSLMIFEKSNRWKRFSGRADGGVSEGSPLDLVMHIKSCDLQEAASFLSRYV